jgi:hypothetical protein
MRPAGCQSSNVKSPGENSFIASCLLGRCHIYVVSPLGLQNLEVLVRIQAKTNSVVNPRQPAKIGIQ